MMEFLIRRTDGEWFDLPAGDSAAILHPNSFPAEVIEGWGDHRICVLDEEIAFSYEDPGIQVSFESGIIPAGVASQIVEEVLVRITAATGQAGCVVRIT